MGPSDDSDDRDEGYRDEEDEGPDRDGDDRDDSGDLPGFVELNLGKSMEISGKSHGK